MGVSTDRYANIPRYTVENHHGEDTISNFREILRTGHIARPDKDLEMRINWRGNDLFITALQNVYRESLERINEDPQLKKLLEEKQSWNRQDREIWEEKISDIVSRELNNISGLNTYRTTKHDTSEQEAGKVYSAVRPQYLNDISNDQHYGSHRYEFDCEQNSSSEGCILQLLDDYFLPKEAQSENDYKVSSSYFYMSGHVLFGEEPGGHAFIMSSSTGKVIESTAAEEPYRRHIDPNFTFEKFLAGEAFISEQGSIYALKLNEESITSSKDTFASYRERLPKPLQDIRPLYETEDYGIKYTEATARNLDITRLQTNPVLPSLTSLGTFPIEPDLKIRIQPLDWTANRIDFITEEPNFQNETITARPRIELTQFSPPAIPEKIAYPRETPDAPQKENYIWPENPFSDPVQKIIEPEKPTNEKPIELNPTEYKPTQAEPQDKPIEPNVRRSAPQSTIPAPPSFQTENKIITSPSDIKPVEPGTDKPVIEEGLKREFSRKSSDTPLNPTNPPIVQKPVEQKPTEPPAETKPAIQKKVTPAPAKPATEIKPAPENIVLETYGGRSGRAFYANSHTDYFNMAHNTQDFQKIFGFLHKNQTFKIAADDAPIVQSKAFKDGYHLHIERVNNQGSVTIARGENENLSEINKDEKGYHLTFAGSNGEKRTLHISGNIDANDILIIKDSDVKFTDTGYNNGTYTMAKTAHRLSDLQIEKPDPQIQSKTEQEFRNLAQELENTQSTNLLVKNEQRPEFSLNLSA